MRTFLQRSIMTALATAAIYSACQDAIAISVSVTGSPGPCDMSCYDPSLPPPEWPGDIDDDYGDSNGEGGGSEQEQACEATDPAGIDAYSDALASDASRLIRAQADYMSREYGLLIHRDAQGALRASALVPGAATITRFEFADLGVNPSTIVGVVHNHPREVYDRSQEELQINLNPSSNDWAAADALITEGHADPVLLQLYVVGTDGILREFDYQNKQNYLPYRTRGGGYMVRPGDKVPVGLTAEPCQ